MTSKIFHVFSLVFSLALIYLSAPSLAKRRPVIDITSSIKAEIQISTGSTSQQTQLNPGGEYKLTAKLNEVYDLTGTYGLKYAWFYAYDPARDKGRAIVYWKVDDWGFSISYDKIKYKQDTPWDTE